MRATKETSAARSAPISHLDLWRANARGGGLQGCGVAAPLFALGKPRSRCRPSRLSAAPREGEWLAATRVAALGTGPLAGFPIRNASGSAARRAGGFPPRRQSETHSRTAPDLRSHRIGMPSAPTAHPRTNPVPAVRIPVHRSEPRPIGIRRMMRTPAGEQARKDRLDADPEPADAARGCGGRPPGARSGPRSAARAGILRRVSTRGADLDIVRLRNHVQVWPRSNLA